MFVESVLDDAINAAYITVVLLGGRGLKRWRRNGPHLELDPNHDDRRAKAAGSKQERLVSSAITSKIVFDAHLASRFGGRRIARLKTHLRRCVYFVAAVPCPLIQQALTMGDDGIWLRRNAWTRLMVVISLGPQ